MKYIFFTLLYPTYLISMESREISQQQIFPGLPNDVSRLIIQETLNSSVEENQFKDPVEDIKKLADQRLKLLLSSKAFKAEQELIDKKTIEILKKYDPSLLYNLLLQLGNKEIKNRFSLGNLLVQAGASTEKVRLLETDKTNREFITEAVQLNNTSWLKFLIKSKNLHINYIMNIKGVNPSFTINEQPLETALKLGEQYPAGALKVVKLLLKNNANPYSVPLTSNNPRFKNILELFGPKKEMSLASTKRKFASDEAKKISRLLEKFGENNPDRLLEGQKAKDQAKKNPNIKNYARKN